MSLLSFFKKIIKDINKKNELIEIRKKEKAICYHRLLLEDVAIGGFYRVKGCRNIKVLYSRMIYNKDRVAIVRIKYINKNHEEREVSIRMAHHEEVK